MYRKWLISLIFFYLSFNLQSQITGTVVDKANNIPIEYATIIIKESDEILDGTISKPDGGFIFPKIGSKIITLEIP